MRVGVNVNLQLNPRYIQAGFKTQAKNISQTRKKAECKLACLLEVIAAHIIKHGHDCFASTPRLLSMYNNAASRYGVKPIKERAMFNLLNTVESKGFISRTHERNDAAWQTKRHIKINLATVQDAFAGAINWAIKAANAYVNRQKVQSSRSGVENSPIPSDIKGSDETPENKKCSVRSKDLSKESKLNKYNGFPSDSFFMKFFGAFANDAKSLQLAAKEGRITASGARKLIGIHAKLGFDLAKPFKRYLDHVIAKEHAYHQEQSRDEQQIYGGTSQKALQAANEDCLKHCQKWVDEGRGEFRRDLNGRIYYRDLMASKTIAREAWSKLIAHYVNSPDETLNWLKAQS